MLSPVNAIKQTCIALTAGNIEQAKYIIRTKYPHVKPLKKRKSFMAKSTSTLEEIGWTLHPPGKLEDWDGLSGWFIRYVAANPALLLNNDLNNWYRACQDCNLT